MQEKIKIFILGFLLIAVQVLFLQQLTLGDVADYFVPFVYPMLIFVLPFTFNKHWLMVVGLVSGWVVDMFYNTPGLNASAAVLVAFLRPFALSLIAPRDGFDWVKPPGYFSMGANRFTVYVFVLLFIYHLWFFSLEVFKISYLHIIFLKAFFSSLLATVLVVITSILTSSKN